MRSRYYKRRARSERALLGVIVAIGLLRPVDCAFAIEFEKVAIPAQPSETWGASWGDVNSDGYPDIYISNHRNYGTLLVNDRQGGFADESASWDTEGKFTAGDLWVDTHGSTWADLDNDGDDDLILTVSTQEAVVLINDGESLVNRQVELGITVGADVGMRQPIVFDYNHDGLLDVKIVGTRETAQTPTMFRQLPNKTFEAVGELEQFTCLLGVWAVLGDFDASGQLDFACSDATGFPSTVYEFSSGVVTDTSFAKTIRSRDAVSGDFDGDQRLDLVNVIGAYQIDDASLIGSNQFEIQITLGGDSTRSVHITTSGTLTLDAGADNWNLVGRFGHDQRVIYVGSNGHHPDDVVFSLDPTDSGNHGIQSPGSRPGMFVGYNVDAQRWELEVSAGGSYSYGYFIGESSQPISSIDMKTNGPGDFPVEPQLLSNQGGAGFVDASSSAALPAVKCVSGAAADFDNDMDLDLFLACRAGTSNIANRLFENIGGARFQEVLNMGAEGLTGTVVADAAGTSESVSFADYDVDGFVDLFVTNGLNMWPRELGGEPELFRNLPNSNSWIELDLIGIQSNRDGVGAIITADTAGLVQYREQYGGYHRWSQNHQRIHFGLADNETVSVTVKWPAGAIDTYSDLMANNVYELTEGGLSNVLPIGPNLPGPNPPPLDPPATTRPAILSGGGAIYWLVFVMAATWGARLLNRE